MYTQYDLAYLAGLLDGEGCFSLKRNNYNHYVVTITIGMTDFKTLEWVHQTFGGTFFASKSANEKAENVYTWALSKRLEIEQLLLALKPYVKTKLLPLLIIEEFCKNFPKNKAYTDEKRLNMLKYLDAMKVANARGPGTAAPKEKFLCVLLNKPYVDTSSKMRTTIENSDELLLEIF